MRLWDVSARGDVVLDSFLGSGTTTVAAERTGRICHGIDSTLNTLITAIRRWQGLTGLNAKHGISGRTFNELEHEASDDQKR